MRKLIIITVSVLMASCSLSPIKEQRTGESIDILRSNEKITVTPSGDNNITITVKTKSGQNCTGKFKLTGSSSGIPMLTAPSNSYQGKFSPDSADCKEALGKNSVVNISLEHTASLSIFGSIGDEVIGICNELDGLICLPKNTFKLN